VDHSILPSFLQSEMSLGCNKPKTKLSDILLSVGAPDALDCGGSGEVDEIVFDEIVNTGAVGGADFGWCCLWHLVKSASTEDGKRPVHATGPERITVCRQISAAVEK
jgi:hypothetical protein